MNNKEQIKNHMEYLGYNVIYHETLEDIILCSKRGYPPTMLECKEHGIRFFAFYNMNEIAKNNPVEFKNYVNRLNRATCVIKFFVDKDGNFNFGSFSLGEYDRQQFADFIYLWENDLGPGMDNVPGTDRFLLNMDNLPQEDYESNSTAYA